MKTITLAHSDLTKTIYAIIGKEKIDITNQAIAEVKAIKALEQDNEEIFKKFKKKVFLESEDVLGNEMVDSYMITDYLAELMGVGNERY